VHSRFRQRLIPRDSRRESVIKTPGPQSATKDQKTHNKLLRGAHGIGERVSAVVIVRFKALRRVSLDPDRIGAIISAALVLLHHENNRTI
jgi:hypothetical protein